MFFLVSGLVFCVFFLSVFCLVSYLVSCLCFTWSLVCFFCVCCCVYVCGSDACIDAVSLYVCGMYAVAMR